MYDDEKTNLLKYWDDTFRYITRAKAEGSKVLVHCKMGVSRSASVVIAYAMKAYQWEFQQALEHVKKRRSCIKPNKNFLNQLETYSGMLDAMKNKEKLQRSKSETNLKSTKDARLLPGSEPTPLIQALNQAKSKSTGEAGVTPDGEEEDGSRMHRRSIAQKSQRRMVRRSSSTSPKTQTAVVTKQQSQSMENLTPERSVAEEPKICASQAATARTTASPRTRCCTSRNTRLCQCAHEFTISRRTGRTSCHSNLSGPR